MKIFDISWPLSEIMTQYKNNKSVKLTVTKTMENNGVREWNICMSNHAGTHIDNSAHFLATGQTIDTLTLNNVVGQCRVLDMTSIIENIMENDLLPFNITESEIIILKTTNSFYAPDAVFSYNFVYLDQFAAQYLAKQNIKAIGFDYLGIERNQPGHETHKAFMENNIPIIEGLRLGQVPAGNYFFVSLPLNIIGIDSAPARAILIKDLVLL